MSGARRRLVVNADDFGFTRDVNEGIVEAHRNGILTATTLMANGAAFEHAVRLARSYPDLDIGCHLVLVQGESVHQPGRALPSSLPELLRRLAAGQLAVYGEMRAQLQRLLDAGVRVSHLDTHKHTHLVPPVLKAMLRVAREFEIPWIRRPFDLPLSTGPAPESLSRRLLTRGVRHWAPQFDRLLRESGCRSTDHFAGFAFTGYYRTADLAGLLRRLPPGTTEFMCHPGKLGADLRSAETRLKESREQELAALCATETREAVTEAGIELTGYAGLAG